MKANLPKAFNQLSKNEQDRIMKQFELTLDDTLCDAQIIWIKMACCILHDIGLTESQITNFVGLWNMMYRRNSRFKDKGAQDAFLNAKMAKIFGEEGFPEEFVQSMREIGRE